MTCDVDVVGNYVYVRTWGSIYNVGTGNKTSVLARHNYPPRACAARGNVIGLGVGMYVRMYVCVQKNLNHTLAAISHHETMVEGSLFSLHTNALAVEAIGASCTRQFSRQVGYSIT